jgi:NAD(P)-dependent dehydrogenase (short-subunit alcohol dehydrogenase family)
MMDTQFRLDGQVAVVTGGGQGIGAAICRRLAAAGARVGVLDRETQPAQTLADELGGLAVTANVTAEAEIQRAIAQVEAKLGPVSILVNNAGITGRSAPVWELSQQEFDIVLAVNVTGVFLCSKAVIPGMISRQYGRIVNIASVAGKEGNPNLGPYSASKAAVIGLTKSMAKELVGKGNITVNSISPAVIATPILEGLPQSTIDYMVSRIPMGRVGKPEEVAALVQFLVSAEASFTTGQCYDISGGRSTY